MRLTERAAALAAFLLLVMPLVFYCALRVPLGQVPDETTHAARVESLLHGQIIGYRVARPNAATLAPDAGVTGNIGFALAVAYGNGEHTPLPASATRAARLAWARSIPWAPAAQFISCVNTAAYAPIGYVPAALGLVLAEAQGLLPHDAAIVARLGNVLAFAILGLLALLLARRGRLLFLMVLGLPMTIWLAGSLSQDGVLIATATLALALLTRGSRAAYWAGLALLAVLALQKPPFMALMLLAFVVPVEPRLSRPARIAGAALVTLPAMLWSIAVMRLVSVPLRPDGLYHPGPLWPGDPNQLFHSAIAAAQIKVLLHHPVTVALLPLTADPHGFPSLWAQTIGVLGPFSIRLRDQLYQIFTLALLSAAAALLTSGPRRGGGPWLVALTVIAALGAAELIFLVEYLTWTPVGALRIDGVQGRYFVPLLPLLALVLGRVRPIPARFAWVWWICPLLALVAFDSALPGIIASRYGL